MPSWSDFGNMWGTLRELDVSAIREEAERAMTIACVGTESALRDVQRLLEGNGSHRYPAVGTDPLVLVPLAQFAANKATVESADVLIIALDTTPLTAEDQAVLQQLAKVPHPGLTVVLRDNRPVAESTPRVVTTNSLWIADPEALDAADKIASAVFKVIPSELTMATARRLPGLRPVYAREQINSVSFTNSSYSLATGLPEMLPVLNIPFAAADILVLTKNQAILVYRLALAHGAPPDFQDRIREVLPVVGGAFLWRQAARSLIGLIPVWGIIPKVAIAYAGTYTTGVVAWRWYARGELVSSDQLRRISQDALTLGRKQATDLLEHAKQAQSGVRTQGQGLLARLKRPKPEPKLLTDAETTQPPSLLSRLKQRVFKPKSTTETPPQTDVTPGE